MKKATKALKPSHATVRRRVLYRVSFSFIALSICVLNPGLVLAQEATPNERIRSDAGKDDIKPAHVIYHAIVRSTALVDKPITLLEVQQHFRVTKQRAEEIHAYFTSIYEKIEDESLQNQLDVLCPPEGRPTGARLGHAFNTVDDVKGVIELKYFTLAKLYLSPVELQALDEWIEERQRSVRHVIFDHTKTHSIEENERRLDSICTRLAIRKENRS